LYTNKTFFDNQEIRKQFSDTLDSLLGSVDSDTLFDTNIYTTSYITFQADIKILDKFYKKHKCSDTIFYYVRYNEITCLSENVWAFLHFYKVIYEYFSHDIATTIWKYVYNKLQKNAQHLELLPELYDKINTMYCGNSDVFCKLNYSKHDKVKQFSITNKNIQNVSSPTRMRRRSSSIMNFFTQILGTSKTQDKNYKQESTNTLQQETQKINKTKYLSIGLKVSQTKNDENMYSINEEEYIQKDNNLLDLPSGSKKSEIDTELLSFYDTIAFINFHSTDTYFTRGAFLDVVVNCQMCQNKYEKLLLTDNDYLNSFIENISFLLYYPNSDKYLNRLNNCIDNMNFLKGDMKFQLEYLIYLSKIKIVQKSCKRDKIVSVFEIYLQDCNYYALFQSCIKLLTYVSSIYFSNNPYTKLDKKLKIVSGEKYVLPLYYILDYEV
jgi:hypothetical protein